MHEGRGSVLRSSPRQTRKGVPASENGMSAWYTVIDGFWFYVHPQSRTGTV